MVSRGDLVLTNPNQGLGKKISIKGKFIGNNFNQILLKHTKYVSRMKEASVGAIMISVRICTCQYMYYSTCHLYPVICSQFTQMTTCTVGIM